jgi:hypothetical protein
MNKGNVERIKRKIVKLDQFFKKNFKKGKKFLSIDANCLKGDVKFSLLKPNAPPADNRS